MILKLASQEEDKLLQENFDKSKNVKEENKNDPLKETE